MKLVLCSLALVFLAIGCGAEGSASSAARESSVRGPHGGPLVTLPDGLGTLEIRIERDSPTAKTDRVVVYTSGQAPDTLQVALADPYRPPQDIRLTLERRASAETRFVSEPGDYQVEPLVGKVTGVWNGREIAIDFANGR